MIRIDAIWLATEPMDMRAGTDTALARVVAVFGAAKPHCAYLFANRRANRMKVLVHAPTPYRPKKSQPSRWLLRFRPPLRKASRLCPRASPAALHALLSNRPVSRLDQEADHLPTHQAEHIGVACSRKVVEDGGVDE
ncbi:IS66 family insertion sequence element accessory protein TnpB [Pseudomonas cavernicola]|uniref:IS66 family insertion sequence element accessory protein TnpB n=1 Tax=Pseudomonas cavernicola TaxID=2320866 RepID=UPI001EE53DBA|nr:IS66 family insertion sequence element accessory protein TnpB [Pseudomonas cavernicola]